LSLLAVMQSLDLKREDFHNCEKSYQKLLTLSFQIGILVHVAATAGQPSAEETKKIIEISC